MYFSEIFNQNQTQKAMKIKLKKPSSNISIYIY